MSAETIQVITYAISSTRSALSGRQAPSEPLDRNISYYSLSQYDIRTLSVNGASDGRSLRGLLYVPTLDTEDCDEHIPRNVTRKADLPSGDYPLVALAPWDSQRCTLSYLEAARGDGRVEAFIFYLPFNNTGTPPLANSDMWSLSDGGQWKRDNEYPVYALPGNYGQQLMNESQYWSGSVEEAPLTGDLPPKFNEDAYVRLVVDIDTGRGSRWSGSGSGSSLPSLWVFLLIVLAILLGVIGLTSIVMHYLQRRRRNELRNRVAHGRVDLEALGIKRLTVPQELLDKMPLYTYGSRAPGQYDNSSTANHNANIHLASSEKRQSPTWQETDRPGSPSSATHARPALRNNHHTPDPFAQPTCAICLDDFVPSSTTPVATQGTTVRELPCHHIFHPECVDAFLRDNSSLCPLCKKTALPPGYCPKTITNAMVRRERLMRRMRERGHTDPESELPALPPEEGQRAPAPGFRAVSDRLRRGYRRWNGSNSNSNSSNERRISSAPAQPMTDLSSRNTPQRPDASLARSVSERHQQQSRSNVQPENTAGRREWARQRALAMLGRRGEVQDPDEQEARTRSRWRKVAGGVFPSLGR